MCLIPILNKKNICMKDYVYHYFNILHFIELIVRGNYPKYLKIIFCIIVGLSLLWFRSKNWGWGDSLNIHNVPDIWHALSYIFFITQHWGGQYYSLICMSENTDSQISSNMLFLYRVYMGALEFKSTPVCCNHNAKQSQSHILSLVNKWH